MKHPELLFVQTMPEDIASALGLDGNRSKKQAEAFQLSSLGYFIKLGRFDRARAQSNIIHDFVIRQKTTQLGMLDDEN